MSEKPTLDEARSVAREFVYWARKEGYQASNILALLNWRGVNWKDVENGVVRWWIYRDGTVRPEGNALTKSEQDRFVSSLENLGDIELFL